MVSKHCLSFIPLALVPALAALLLAPQAYAAGPGGGGPGGRPAPPQRVIPVPTPVPGTNIVIPAGTPIGSVIGIAPAVPGFPGAPITLQPNRTNGHPHGGA